MNLSWTSGRCWKWGSGDMGTCPTFPTIINGKYSFCPWVISLYNEGRPRFIRSLRIQKREQRGTSKAVRFDLWNRGELSDPVIVLPTASCDVPIADLREIAWGAAYCIKGGQEKEQAAMQYLERRECEYDTKVCVDFYKEGDPFKPAILGVLVFTSTPDKEANRYYLGPAPLQDMARQIATASGPCGNNRDYLFLLEKAMLEIGHEDARVIELANEVRKVLAKLREKKITSPRISTKSHLPRINFACLPETAVASSR